MLRARCAGRQGGLGGGGGGWPAGAIVMGVRSSSRRDEGGGLGARRAPAQRRAARASAVRPVSARPPDRPIRARAGGVAWLPSAPGVPAHGPPAGRAPPRLQRRRARLAGVGVGVRILKNRVSCLLKTA